MRCRPRLKQVWTLGEHSHVHVARLALHDFRSYASVDLELSPGVSAFIGSNGQGKTNIVEAVDYMSRLESHRVSSDQALVRVGAPVAVVRCSVVKQDRSALLELEITPGKSNKARINRGALPRTRDLAGVLRTVIFSPEDLALVKGDPSDRRRFLDSLLVVQSPRLAGVKSDYERVLKQRNTLLKSARGKRNVDVATLDIWDEKLIATGSELILRRLSLIDELSPYLADAYRNVAADAPEHRRLAKAVYSSTVSPLDSTMTIDQVRQAFADCVAKRRSDELERGVSLVGPHRDELVLSIGELPAKGYSSHGESWSFALALKLASFELLRADGDDPVLILDDVFAELDEKRRQHLAQWMASAEQVLMTAAVANDVPSEVGGQNFYVANGQVTRG